MISVSPLGQLVEMPGPAPGTGHCGCPVMPGFTTSPNRGPAGIRTRTWTLEESRAVCYATEPKRCPERDSNPHWTRLKRAASALGYRGLEARAGVAPAHGGFADRSLAPWVPCRQDGWGLNPEMRFWRPPVSVEPTVLSRCRARGESRCAARTDWRRARDSNPHRQGRTGLANRRDDPVFACSPKRPLGALRGAASNARGKGGLGPPMPERADWSETPSAKPR